MQVTIHSELEEVFMVSEKGLIDLIVGLFPIVTITKCLIFELCLDTFFSD